MFIYLQRNSVFRIQTSNKNARGQLNALYNLWPT